MMIPIGLLIPLVFLLMIGLVTVSVIITIMIRNGGRL